MISAQKICRSEILQGVDIEVAPGECVGLIGPNGAGKTTLLRSMMKMDTQATGACNLWSLDDKTRARTAGWLAQERNVSWELTVRQVVELGRIPWRGFAGRAHRDDRSEVQNAIAHLGLMAFENRPFIELSGGERARVLIARLLAQTTPMILADEPIAALDPRFQLQMMSLFQSLARDGKGVLLSIHDLGLAARFCTRLVLLHEGQVFANGAPDEVLSDKNIAEVFGIKVERASAHFIQPSEML